MSYTGVPISFLLLWPNVHSKHLLFLSYSHLFFSFLLYPSFQSWYMPVTTRKLCRLYFQYWSKYLSDFNEVVFTVNLRTCTCTTSSDTHELGVKSLVTPFLLPKNISHSFPTTQHNLQLLLVTMRTYREKWPMLSTVTHGSYSKYKYTSSTGKRT